MYPVAPTMTPRTSTTVAASLALLASCTAPRATVEGPVEGTSLLGAPLERYEPADPEARERHATALAEARERWEAEGTEEAAIWVGRQMAYLGRVGEAIDWYTARLEDFPDSHRLRRHRGHRWISTRRYGNAVADLSEAWELGSRRPDAVEPDGIPNAAGIPTGTDYTSILYHLALAHYLRGDFDRAAFDWRGCLAHSGNDDMRVAAANWLVHALRRSGRGLEAGAVLETIDPELELLENHDYHSLLLLQKGLVTPDELLADADGGIGSATLGYGIGNWEWCEGRREAARERWRDVVADTPWPAFGHAAAEAELAR